MTRGDGRLERAFVAVLAVTAILVACSSGDEPSDQGGSTTWSGPDRATGMTATRWVVTSTDDGFEIEADAYRITVGTTAGLQVGVRTADGRPFGPEIRSDADPASIDHGLFVVRGGQRLPVDEVTDTKPGMDHVTLTVTFADGSTGRVELGEDGDRGLAVRVFPDAPDAESQELHLAHP